MPFGEKFACSTDNSPADCQPFCQPIRLIKRDKKEIMEAEDELIYRAQAGDQRAFAELMRKYDKRVYCLIYDLLGNTADTQDAFQETFLRVFRHLDSFRMQSKFSTWLVRTAINTAIDHLRRRKIRHFWSLDAVQLSEPKEVDSAFIEQTQADRAAEESDFWRQVNRLVRKLPARQSSVFTLRHFHGYKISEIAAILQISEGTVKNALFRATQTMQKSLLPYKTQD